MKNEDVASLHGILPTNILNIAIEFDQIIHANFDSIVVSLLCLLPPLCAGATVSQTKGAVGRPIIIYMMLLAPSGVGKTSVASVGRKYMLNWLDDEYKKLEKASKNDEIRILPDVFLDGASAEGLEASFVAGSSPHAMTDEFGKFANTAKSDSIKASYLRMLMQIFDSGTLVTRKLKDSKRSKLLVVNGMGLFTASTIGQSNLTPADMRNMISDGFINRFLVIFGRYKRIPLRQELSTAEAENIESFARKFNEFSKKKAFYLGVDAYKIYKNYHDNINEKYYAKYLVQDDTAGMEVRLLTISQRIAMLFHVCSNVENDDPNNVEIGEDAMNRAVKLLEYLDKNHFDQILLYASSKDGRPTMEDRVKRELEKKSNLSVRDLVRNLSGSNTSQIRTIMERLVKADWAVQEENHLFRKK
ncbi:MAG: DUF3987 domain-containing protein [Sulfuricurvum sp.]